MYSTLLYFLFNKERDPLFGNPSVVLLVSLPFTFSFFPFPLELLGAWSRLGLEVLGGLAFPT
jgi:hypothetical protein